MTDNEKIIKAQQEAEDGMAKRRFRLESRRNALSTAQYLNRGQSSVEEVIRNADKLYKWLTGVID